MSERVVRMARKQANEAAKQTEQALSPAIQAALQNERLTRERVDAVETRLQEVVMRVRGFHTMSRWERLRWLLR